MMEIGMGVLGWSPNEFWSATLRDFSAAFAGWNEVNGSAEKHIGQKHDYRRMAEVARSMPETVNSIGKINGR
jgi:hypothetical protein